MASFMRKIRMIVRAADAYRDEQVQAEGIRPYHHVYVLAIVRNPGMTQEELAARLCTTKSTVARQLDHLEKNGYVERRSRPDDRRVSLVYPTERMLALFPEVDAARQAWNGYLFAELSEEEREAFDAILNRVSARAGDYVSGKDGPTV